MSSNNNNYRPRSPDLSASFVPPPTLGRLPSYSRGPGESYNPFSPRASLDINTTSSFTPSPNTTANPSYFGDQHQVQSPSPAIRTPTIPNYPNYQANFNSYQANAQPRVPPTFQSPLYSQPTYYDDAEMARTRAQRSAEQNQHQYDPHHAAPSAPQPFLPQAQAEPPHFEPQQPQAPAGPTTDPAVHLDIKTRFPVARIKRIMQADEDIGKVAQATPTATAKALELFMASLTIKSAHEAKQGGSKRITVGHLKAAIAADSNFDFLKAICDQAPDDEKGGAKKGRGKSEDASDDESGHGKVKKRKGSDEEYDN